MSNNFKISDILDDKEKNLSPLLQVIRDEENNFESSSSHYNDVKDFIGNVINPKISDFKLMLTQNIEESYKKQEQNQIIYSDSIVLKGWKNVENISARLIEHFDDVVILECLIDKELKLYEEREFRSSLFEGYDLEIGNLFYLRFFDRQNETKMEIHNDPRLTFIEDFPKMNFTKLFKQSKLFKK